MPRRGPQKGPRDLRDTLKPVALFIQVITLRVGEWEEGSQSRWADPYNGATQTHPHSVAPLHAPGFLHR